MSSYLIITDKTYKISYKRFIPRGIKTNRTFFSSFLLPLSLNNSVSYIIRSQAEHVFMLVTLPPSPYHEKNENDFGPLSQNNVATQISMNQNFFEGLENWNKYIGYLWSNNKKCFYTQNSLI